MFWIHVTAKVGGKQYSMNEKKSEPNEIFNDSQLVYLWDLHHDVDLPFTDFDWRSWERGIRQPKK